MGCGLAAPPTEVRGCNSTAGDFAKDLADLVETRSFSLIRDGIRYYNPRSTAGEAAPTLSKLRLASAVSDCPRFAGAWTPWRSARAKTSSFVERFLQGGV